MKKIGALVCSIWILCLALSGCGGSKSKTSSSQSSSTKTLVSITVTSANQGTSLAAGQKMQLTALGKYSDGTITDITSQASWQSSDSTVAALSTSGMLTSYKAGTVSASASQNGVSGSMTITVNQAALSSIVISGNASLAAGQSEQLAAQGTYSDSSSQTITGQVTWQSSDVTVATVNSAGLLTSLKAGAVTITATMSSVSGTAGVTVTSAVLTGINVGATSPSIASGVTEQLTATAVYSDNSTQSITSQVTWQSSDATVATVSSTGLLTALKSGSVIATATWNGISGSATITVNAASLSSISISPSVFSIAAGQNKQLSVMGIYSDGSSHDVTSQAAWVAGNTAAASVDSNGLVTGVAQGTSTITASVSGKQATAAVTVSTALLQSILVTPATASIATGQTQAYTANGIFSDGSTTDLTNSVIWSSSATGVASIDQTGLATGVSTGSANITAASGTVTSTPVPLAVTAAVLTAIDIAPDGQYIPVGGQYQLAVTGTYSDGSTQNLTNATWSSSDPTLATVDSNGNVTGVANSNNNPVTITASYGGQTNTTTVYITDAVPESLQLTPSTASIAAGTTVQYSVNVVYSDGSIQPVTAGLSWLTSAPSIAGVNASGLATGLAPGQATVTVAYNSMTATASLTVTQATLTNIVVTPITTVVGINGNVQFTATGVFSDNSTQDLTSQAFWTSSNAGAALISAGGVATGISAGTTTITATYGSVNGSATLNVTTATLIGITINPQNPTVPTHSKVQLTAIGNFSDGSQLPLVGVSWHSSAPQFAMVVGNGVLRTKNKANHTVTVSATLSGVSGQTTVNITNLTIQTLTINPSSQTIPVGTTFPFQLLATLSDGSTKVDLTASARWQTSNYVDAVINRQGVASGLATGTVTITASVNGQSPVTATLTVSNATIQSITVAPATPTIGLGSQQQFTATGQFSDGSSLDITSVATWSSSAPTVAVINQAGLASSASHGQTNITATFQGTPGSTLLTVN